MVLCLIDCFVHNPQQPVCFRRRVSSIFTSRRRSKREIAHALSFDGEVSPHTLWHHHTNKLALPVQSRAYTDCCVVNTLQIITQFRPLWETHEQMANRISNASFTAPERPEALSSTMPKRCATLLIIMCHEQSPCAAIADLKKSSRPAETIKCKMQRKQKKKNYPFNSSANSQKTNKKYVYCTPLKFADKLYHGFFAFTCFRRYCRKLTI